MNYNRLRWYCVHCGKLRLGPLASETNNLNYPCECGGPIHWTTDYTSVKTKPLNNCLN